MARIRRKLKITGDEYNFGGGASSSSATASSAGGFIKIARGNVSFAHVNHNGYLTSGDTVTLTTDVGNSIATKDGYFWFDNAFDTSTGTISLEFLNGATALPAGVSSANNDDTEGSDQGYLYFNGTPTVVGKTSFKIKATYPSGPEFAEITFVLNVLPSGTTPVWASSTLPAKIIQNAADDQVLAAGPQTNFAGVTYTLSGVSGFAAGVTPAIDSVTGRVFVANVGAIVQSASAHAFTVTADLGEYGTMSQTFTGNIEYGDAYGAAYFGPGNSMRNPASYGAAYTGAYMTDAQYAVTWNTSVNAGALRCRTSNQYSTSPYKYNENFGLRYTETTSWSSGEIGYLFPKCSSNTNTASNGYVVRFKWIVPAGVTKFSVVCVGAGSMGAYSWSNKGGGGGGTAWLNDVLCTPGEEFDVAVGLGRRTESSASSYWSGSTWIRRLVARDYGANELLCVGYGGGYQSGHSTPLNGRNNPDSANMNHIEYYQYNNSQDAGSAAVSKNYGTNGYNRGGRATNRSGGGAAGYEGPGADGSSVNGTGGSAGSGWYYSSTYGASAGGGVGLDGRGGGGTDGAGSGYGGNQGAWTSNYESDGTNAYYGGGGGGSGGSRGSYGENSQTSNSGIQNQYINGGMHGGGGGGSGTNTGGGAGGMGGIRIIWGDGRAFPSTYTTEDPSISDSTNPGDGR